MAYADCPFCGDRRGRLALYHKLDTWRCWHCGEHGGMLLLYGKSYGVSNSEAYRNICDTLAAGGFSPATAYQIKEPTHQMVPSDRAAKEEIHRTLTALLSLLTLRPKHREHLRTARGLTDEQISSLGFKSTPPGRQCRSLTVELIAQGYTVAGVPGFYVNDYGKWTVKFYSRTSGILIPLRDVDGLLRGLQIRLDDPIRNENDPPEKVGTKYLPLTSSGKNGGVSSGTPIHFIGNPHARVVYVTEGALKADIVHALTGRTLIATMGASNTNGLDELFSFLKRNGTEKIIEAEDMDKFRNEAVSRGASMVHQLARKNGLASCRLTWNPNYKGMDDWQLALRRKPTQQEEVQKMTFKEQYLSGLCAFDHIDDCIVRGHKQAGDDAGLREYLGLDAEEYGLLLQVGGDRELEWFLNRQRYSQRFRIYQLDLDGGRVVPFAFSGIKRMRESGFDQPPAPLYRLVYEDVMICPNGQTAQDSLKRIFHRFGDEKPRTYPGRCVAPSDVIELVDEDGSSFFYCGGEHFTPVCFSPELAKPARNGA